MAVERRCCKDTLKWELERLNDLHDGLEIPCRWCDNVWTFTRHPIGWTLKDNSQLAQFLAREATPEAEARRAERMDEILGRKR